MITRRHTLLALPCFSVPSLAYAQEQDQQIALDNPGEFILAQSHVEAQAHNKITPARFKGEAPNYPEEEALNEIEGLVIVGATVQKDGSGRDFEIAKSYPKKAFDKHVMRWTDRFSFTAATINGEARETRRHLFCIFFMLPGPRGISPEAGRRFVKLRDALNSGKAGAVEKALADLEQMRDRGSFNLTELARFNEIAARVATSKNNFIAASEYNADAVYLGKFLDTDAALEAAYRLRVVLYIQLAKFDQAVDTYDAFKKVFPTPEPQLAPAIATLREKGFGKGVSYPVTKQVLRGI